MLRHCALVLLLSALPGCEDDPRYLGHRMFLSESIEGHELVPGYPLRLHFGAEGELDAYAGCNSMSGSHELSGGRIVTPLYFGSTEKGCSTPAGNLHRQEDWFREFLEADPYYELDEPRLVLSDDEVTIVFLEQEIVVPEPRPLQGTRWWMVAFIRSGFAIPSSAGSLLFEDGKLSIVTPCASGESRYEVDGARVVLDGTIVGAPACPDGEFVAKFDSDMREVLADGVVDIELDGGSLTVMRGEVGLMLSAD